MILPLLLSAPPDPWDVLVKVGGWALATLAMGIAAILWKDFSKVKEKVESLEGSTSKALHELDVRVIKLEPLPKRVETLEADTLKVRDFNSRMDRQDKQLEDSLETIRDVRQELRGEIKDLDRSKASRSDLKAVQQRAPAARKDGPYAVIPREEPPSDPPPDPEPPPMRPRAPSSRGRFGGE